MKLKYLKSYRTMKFDTADGDLHKNQYAIAFDSLGKPLFYIRTEAENKGQFTLIDTDDGTDPQAIVAGMVQVAILPGEFMYYDLFELPDGRTYRVSSAKNAYDNLAKKDAKQPEKDVTDSEIFTIKEEDKKWQ